MTDYLLIIGVSIVVSAIVAWFFGSNKKFNTREAFVMERPIVSETPSSIKEPKSEFILDDVGIPGIFLNCYSILMYILAVVVYFFPPPNTLAWDYPWFGASIIAIAGPLGSWALVKDLKANKKRKLAELESKKEEKRTGTQ